MMKPYAAIPMQSLAGLTVKIEPHCPQCVKVTLRDRYGFTSQWFKPNEQSIEELAQLHRRYSAGITGRN